MPWLEADRNGGCRGQRWYGQGAQYSGVRIQRQESFRSIVFRFAVPVIDADDFFIQHDKLRGTAGAEYDPGAFLVPALEAGIGVVDEDGVASQ